MLIAVKTLITFVIVSKINGMLRFKKVFFSIVALLFLSSYAAFAQFDAEIDTIGDNLLFRKELSASAIIHNNGWGIEFRIGKNRSIFDKFMYEANLIEMRNGKEIKTINPFFTNTRSYYYGKLNAVYMLRTGVGQQRMLNRKPYYGGVELRLFYSGGLSTAFAKPVYLNIIVLEEGTYNYYPATEKYDPDEHFPENIFGRASFFKGFNQLKVYPGIYAKAGLSVDFGALNQKPKIVEAGVAFDYFPKGIPMMAFIEPNQFFMTLYLSFGIGKRYN